MSKPKPTGREWGEGPWAEAAPKSSLARTPKQAQSVLPTLEDVFNQKVKTQYRPLQRLRAGRGVWLVRGVMIALVVVAWVLTYLNK